jgi:hypothetical protein
MWNLAGNRWRLFGMCPKLEIALLYIIAFGLYGGVQFEDLADDLCLLTCSLEKFLYIEKKESRYHAHFSEYLKVA